MKLRCGWACVAVVAAMMAQCECWAGDPLYLKPAGQATRWSSFENPKGAPGAAGGENRGAKGHAFDHLAPGQSHTLMQCDSPGKITRMWFTIDDRSTLTLRSLRLEMFWDGAKTPAVSVPFGDFFGVMVAEQVAYENELFSSGEGRSFVCFIPMPFRKSARVTLTNEAKSGSVKQLFYDIDYVVGPSAEPNPMYFHSTWRRDNPTASGKDFEILPRLQGAGRFLGCHIGVVGDKRNPGWWGEGEVKMYLDGDRDLPTLCGTGTEDYIGTAWGQVRFFNRYHGCSASDEAKRLFSFYRFHVPDPVYFDKNARVTIQQMGGDGKTKVIEAMKDEKLQIQPVTITHRKDPGKPFAHELLLDSKEAVALDKHPAPDDGWTNYYRSDDVCATAYFYLDRAENGLPPLAPVAQRTADSRFP